MHLISADVIITRASARHDMIDRMTCQHQHSLSASIRKCTSFLPDFLVARYHLLALAGDTVRHMMVFSLDSLLEEVRSLPSAPASSFYIGDSDNQ